jgi:hypothetical protein
MAAKVMAPSATGLKEAVSARPHVQRPQLRMLEPTALTPMARASAQRLGIGKGSGT